MPQYSMAGVSGAMTTAYKTVASIAASTTSGNTLRRGRVYDFTIGPSGSPNSTDCGAQYDLSRITASGTYTAGTPNAADPADVAYCGIAGITYSAEPTVTSSSSVWNTGANQRAAVRWVASGPDAEFIHPATTINGFALRAVSSGGLTGVESCIIQFRE